MALRLFLVALVGLMSFELPSVQDFSSWKAKGDRWVESRLADLSHLKCEVEDAINHSSQTENAPVAKASDDSLAREIVQMRVDAAFETAMDGLSTNFRADLSEVEASRPVAEEAPKLAKVVDFTQPLIEQPEPACFDPQFEVAPPGHFFRTVETSKPIDRLSSAVNLTRQALSAWASLIEAESEDAR
jgi:hypothetical protein